MMFVLVLSTPISFSSCSSDDDDNGNGGTNSDWGKGTWYAKKSSINEVKVSKTAFAEIEKAIDNHELLFTYKGHYSSAYNIDYYADRSDFVSSDGSFSTYSNHKGRLEGTVDGSL